MNNFKILVSLGILVLIVGGALFFLQNRQVTTPNKTITQEPADVSDELIESLEETEPVTVNKQASFAIFTNGTYRVFTAAMYHNLSDKVYIEAAAPNIIKIKKSETTWGDFFTTLPFELTHTCLTTGTKETFCTGDSGTLKFYLNGVQVQEVLNKEIQDSDKLLVTFGNETEEQIKQQLVQ